MGNELKGAKEFVNRLLNIAKKLPNAVGTALYQESLIEEKESRRRTPVLTGELRASHVTQRPVIQDGEISVSIEVGGPTAPYALEVHENLEAEHKNGQAKFLESTIKESAPFMGARVARRLEFSRLVKS